MYLKRIKNIYSHVVFHLPVEAIVWTVGLMILAMYNPHHESHMSMCVLSNLGFKYCPGCGLGRSISYFLHGDIMLSLTTHPIGITAVTILGYRIYRSSIDYLKRLKT